MAGQRVTAEAAAAWVMASQRVPKQSASGPVRQVHVQFDAKIGRLFLTRMGRMCKLLRVEPPTRDRPDSLLGFGYVDVEHRVIRVGATIDGFDMHERVASRLLTPVGMP